MPLTQDKYRFLMSSSAGLLLALPYRYIPKSLRNEYNYLPGIFMVYYCFGRQANMLVLFSAISYVICKFTSYKYVQQITMCSSIAFLSYAHLSRQIMDYGAYLLDISGPFMIAVQKMTSLGFCLHDGKVMELEIESNKKSKSDLNSEVNKNNIYSDDGASQKLIKNLESTKLSPSVTSAVRNIIRSITYYDTRYLTDEQRKYAVTNVPSFNEFMGYFFHFPSVLCGPVLYFKDYSNYVNGPEKVSENWPGQYLNALKKLTISISCAILYQTLYPKFAVEFLRSPEFLIHTSFVIRFYYIIIFTMLSRLKYYIAWHFSEAIINTSGLGFNGYDSNGKPRWNLISNINLVQFETSLNLRDAIHAWNKSTQIWLRRTAYERASRKLSVVATYMLSAVWHGFYPGYYMTFLTGALFTHAARSGRRIIRPKFQQGKILPKFYDAITFILTKLAIAYAAFPFVILDFSLNYRIYKSLYFSIHIFALGGVLLGYIFK